MELLSPRPVDAVTAWPPEGALEETANVAVASDGVATGISLTAISGPTLMFIPERKLNPVKVTGALAPHALLAGMIPVRDGAVNEFTVKVTAVLVPPCEPSFLCAAPAPPAKVRMMDCAEPV